MFIYLEGLERETDRANNDSKFDDTEHMTNNDTKEDRQHSERSNDDAGGLASFAAKAASEAVGSTTSHDLVAAIRARIEPFGGIELDIEPH